MDQPGKETSLQTTLLHRKQPTVLCHLVLHHLFWQLILHVDRADRWERSFHSQDPSHQGFLSAQGKWFSLLSAQWNIKHVPQTSSSHGDCEHMSLYKEKGKAGQTPHHRNRNSSLNLPLHPCCWKNHLIRNRGQSRELGRNHLSLAHKILVAISCIKNYLYNNNNKKYIIILI